MYELKSHISQRNLILYVGNDILKQTLVSMGPQLYWHGIASRLSSGKN